MITIGLVELTGTLDYIPESGDGWKLIKLVAKQGIVPVRAFSNPKLNAVAFLGPSVRRPQLAETAAEKGKHVLLDFPASRTIKSARRIESIATSNDVIVYSPNLLKYEPGFQEVKRISSMSKMTSLTVTCGIDAKPTSAEASMKLAQLLDATEWLAGSKISNLRAEKSSRRSRVSALVALGSFENGVKVMLNLYSAPSKRSRLWIDAVSKASFLHVDPYAQTVRLTQFQAESARELNWATSPLTSMIEDFIIQVNRGKEPMDLANLERMLNLSDSVTAG
ncbi:MAG TPA: hypothetical protein VMU35_00295 [Methylomirabilota bacterium]|nr:hypothetical protein [Methylomirabilota bacterium]